MKQRKPLKEWEIEQRRVKCWRAYAIVSYVLFIVAMVFMGWKYFHLGRLLFGAFGLGILAGYGWKELDIKISDIFATKIQTEEEYEAELAKLRGS
jgi:hypothetical protein